MKQLLKLFSIVFCAMALYACGSDDEPGKSALQDQFIDVDNSEYTEGSMPVGDTPMLQTATFDKAALPGGTSYLTLNSYEELDYVNIGVEGESGYLKVKLDAPANVQGRATTNNGIYTYTVLVLLSQNLNSSFTLVFTTVNKQGEVSSQFTSETNYIEAGTGDLQVNLRFSNEKDVDLYVVEPNGNVNITVSLSPIIQKNTKLSMTGWKVMIMKMNQMLNGEKSDWILTPMQAATLTGKTVKTFSSKQIACKKEHIRYG